MTAPQGGRHIGPMLPAAPVSDRAQTPSHWRWCARCLVERPTKGGKYRGGLFTCALHRQGVGA